MRSPLSALRIRGVGASTPLNGCDALTHRSVSLAEPINVANEAPDHLKWGEAGERLRLGSRQGTGTVSSPHVMCRGYTTPASYIRGRSQPPLDRSNLSGDDADQELLHPSTCMKSWELRCIAAGLLLIPARAAFATDFQADPSNYLNMLSMLQPGDTLHLDTGNYTNQLNVTNLNGSPGRRITIAGPSSGSPAVFLGSACCNTVEIRNSSYVTIRGITIDAQHISGIFGISANGGTSNLVHDIEIDGCTFLNHDGSQQTDGISTKTPTWGWIIHNNIMIHPGIGLYLGNSDGSDPFVAGIIENNLISNPIGYCMQIKHQAPWPTGVGLPEAPSSTIIRNNVFIKGDGPSPDGNRPNLLVGGLPSTGPGSLNRYEIYGNFFHHNPREALLQVSGRVTIHDNIFVDTAAPAIIARDHDLPLRQAYIYHNTIYAAATGIEFGNSAPQGDAVVGNVIFSPRQISGPISDLWDNVTDSSSNAGQYVAAPSLVLGQMNFYPLPGECQGTQLDMTKFVSDVDYALDFNGATKGTFRFRGAYAGQGTNPGWALDAALRHTETRDPPDGGSPPTSDAGTVGGTPADGGTPTDGGNPASTGVPASPGVPSGGGSGTSVHSGSTPNATQSVSGCGNSIEVPGLFLIMAVLFACLNGAGRSRPLRCLATRDSQNCTPGRDRMRQSPDPM